MKKLLLTSLLLTLILPLQAQEVWFESRYSSYYEYNGETDVYDIQGKEWSNTRFSPDREFIYLELKPGETTKIWWVQDHKKNNCYYTESDYFKFCFNYEENYINIYTSLDSIENRYMNLWRLSKISKIK
tara:strand:+ start:973 stop:1359 length:387 start_codon:yes stop_codon:yes gene_type:complete